MSNSKSIILATSSGYKPKDLAPFVDSLRKTSFDGDICIFVNKNDKECIEYLISKNVKIVRFKDPNISIPFIHREIKFFSLLNKKHKWTYPVRLIIQLIFKIGRTRILKTNSLSKKIILAITFRLSTIMSYRNILYYNFLKKNLYDRIMISDIRDVIIQENPFAFKYPQGISSFLENTNISIAENETNKYWIHTAFNSTVYTDLKNFPVICAGVSIGDYSSMMNYLEKMINIIISIAPENGGVLGIDQGIHNFCLRNDPMANLYENFNGPVLTISSEEAKKIRFNKKGEILNNDGSPVYIIHQYDRDLKIKEKLLKTVLSSSNDNGNNSNL